MPTFGENLRNLRISRGYSQERFAREIGSNQMTVSSWEVGTRTPLMPKIKHIAEVFHVPLSSLISLESTGDDEDIDRELIDIIRSSPKLKSLINRIRYLSDEDINIINDMINVMTRTKV